MMVSVPSDKLKAAESALSQIERQFGKGSIMRLGAKEFAPISSISTGSIGVDAALGVGGLPRGRIIEIFGPESSGKTTLSLHVIAEAQRVGAFPEQRAPDAQSPHEDGQYGRGGERRDAEDEAELAQPRRLVDQRAEAGAEQERGNRRRALHGLHCAL